MKLFTYVLYVLTLTATLIVPAFAQEVRKEEITVKGEVIDLGCYMTNKDIGKGPTHKECALQCAKNGVPLGLLEDETNAVFYVAKMKNRNNANDMLLPFVAEKVLIKGRIAEKGGTKLLLIDAIEKAN